MTERSRRTDPAGFPRLLLAEYERLRAAGLSREGALRQLRNFEPKLRLARSNGERTAND